MVARQTSTMKSGGVRHLRQRAPLTPMLTFAVWVRVPRRVQLFFLPLGPLNVQCGQTLSAGLWEVGSVSQIPSPRLFYFFFKSQRASAAGLKPVWSANSNRLMASQNAMQA